MVNVLSVCEVCACCSEEHISDSVRNRDYLRSQLQALDIDWMSHSGPFATLQVRMYKQINLLRQVFFGGRRREGGSYSL